MKNDRRFDLELHDAARQLEAPPEEIMEQIVPWQRAMKTILWGMGLSFLQFNAAYLQYLLPALGALLMYLGIRTLRQVNRPFRFSWAITLSLLLTKWVSLSLLGLPVPLSDGWVFAFDTWTALLIEALFLSMRAGIRAVWAAHGETPPKDPLLGAVILYPVYCLCALFLSSYGLLLFFPFLIAFILLLYGLWKAAAALDDVGYMVVATPIRWSAKWLQLFWWGSLISVLLVSSLCLTRPPQTRQPIGDLSPQAESIRADLLDLGFPEVLLNDLPKSELYRLLGAKSVSVEGQTQSGSNPTPKVTDWHGTVEAVCVTVQLSDTETRLYLWQRWLDRPSVQLQEGFSLEVANMDTLSDLTGQVVVDQPEGPRTMYFTRLEITTAQNDSIFFGQSTYRGVVGGWSIPLKGELPRCWVGVTCHHSEDLLTWGTVCNIRHQDRFLNYPFEAAYDFCLRGGWDEGAFSTFNTYFNLWTDLGKIEHSRTDRGKYIPQTP